MNNVTFLVTLTEDDISPQYILTLQNDIRDLLLDEGYDVVRVAAWERPSMTGGTQFSQPSSN